MTGWDGDTATVLLLLCLLPPSNQGRGGAGGKMSVGSAVDLLIQFEKVWILYIPSCFMCSKKKIGSSLASSYMGI